MKLSKTLTLASLAALTISATTFADVQIVECDDTSLSSGIYNAFQENSCNVCAQDSTEIVSEVTNGTHAISLENTKIEWKNTLEADTKICGDLTGLSGLELEECKPSQMIYKSSQVDPVIIGGTYQLTNESPDNWIYGESVLWMAYDELDEEFFLTPGDMITYKELDLGKSLNFSAQNPQDEEIILIKQPLAYKSLDLSAFVEGNETEEYNLCTAYKVWPGDSPFVNNNSADTSNVTIEGTGEDLNAAADISKPVVITSEQTTPNSGPEHVFIAIAAMLLSVLYIWKRKTAA